MGDFVKIAVRTATIALIVAAIIVLFGVIQFPAINYSFLSSIVGFAKSMFVFYVPYGQSLLNIIFVLIGVGIALWTFYFATLAYKWIMEANE